MQARQPVGVKVQRPSALPSKWHDHVGRKVHRVTWACSLEPAHCQLGPGHAPPSREKLKPATSSDCVLSQASNKEIWAHCVAMVRKMGSSGADHLGHPTAQLLHLPLVPSGLVPANYCILPATYCILPASYCILEISKTNTKLQKLNYCVAIVRGDQPLRCKSSTIALQ